MREYVEMGKLPSVSIILPVYNVEKYIGQCIDSIMTQTWPNIECIIVDDCATDKSIEVAKNRVTKYQLEGGHIVFRFLSHKNNRGAAAARNTGLLASNSDYIWFVDPDDYIAEDSLFGLLHDIGSNRPDVIHFSYVNFKSDDVFAKMIYKPSVESYSMERLLHDIFLNNIYYPVLWIYLFKNSFLRRNHIVLDECLRYSEDADFLLKFYDVDSVHLLDSSKLCYFHRNSREGSLSNGVRDTENTMMLVERYLDIIKECSGDKKDSYSIYTSELIFNVINVLAQRRSCNENITIEMLEKYRKEYAELLLKSNKKKYQTIGKTLKYSVRFCIWSRRARNIFLIPAKSMYKLAHKFV